MGFNEGAASFVETERCEETGCAFSVDASISGATLGLAGSVAGAEAFEAEALDSEGLGSGFVSLRDLAA